MTWGNPEEATAKAAIVGGLVVAVAAIFVSNPDSFSEAVIVGGEALFTGVLACYIIFRIVVWTFVRLRYGKK